jgi:hypothetical protein
MDDGFERAIIAKPHGYIHAIFGLEASHPGPHIEPGLPAC